MKVKTSLSLDDTATAAAREHAALARVEISVWVERAIRDLAAAEDLERYELWRESWSDEDKAIEAALDVADRGGMP